MFPKSVWAGPIDFTRASDEALLIGFIFTLILLAVQAVIAVWALVRYWKKRKKDKNGWPVWAVVLAVGLALVIWAWVFVNYVQGEGARYIG